jgi:HK97 family phage major capsid protein
MLELKKQQLKDDAEKMLKECEINKRKMTAAEQEEYTSIIDSIEKLNMQIEFERDREVSLYEDARRGVQGSVELTEWIDPGSGKVIRVMDKNSRIDTGSSLRDLGKFLQNVARKDTRQMSAIPSEGGYLLPSYLSNFVYQKLFAESAIFKAGAKLIELEANHKIAKVSAWPTAYWRDWNGAITPSKPTFDQIEFAPKTCAILVKSPVELTEDAPNTPEVLANTFITQLNFEIDRVALVGDTGNDEPDGIINFSGLSDGYDSSGADIDSYLFFTAALESLWKNDVNPNAVICPYNALIDIANLTDQTDQPLQMPKVLADLQWHKTTSLPARPEQTSIMGDFTKLLIGLRSPIKVLPLNELYAENYQIGFLAVMRIDVRAEWEQAFALVKTGAVHT